MSYLTPTELVAVATAALLQQKPAIVMHPEGWARNGFPLPIKRAQPLNGFITQEYRPLAILEYVDELLSGAFDEKKKKPKAAASLGE